MAEGKRAAKKAKKVVPFEKAMERLEEIVETLESGEPSLEASLALFEEGVALSRQCNQRLDAAERRLQVLAGHDEKGDPVLEPLAEEEFLPSPEGNRE